MPKIEMTTEDLELFKRMRALLQAANDLEPVGYDETPSTPLLAAILETVTNRWLIAFLRVVRDNADARMVSRPLSKRSSLFDKLIIMKGEGKSDWVLRLHTYNMPVVKDGERVSNLGETLQDDEENTHLHRWRLSSRFITGGFNNVTWDIRDPKSVEGQHDLENRGGRVLNRYLLQPTAQVSDKDSREAKPLGQDVVTPRRTELYCAGDVIAYPILDPHSVSMLSPLTGTTMTLAHTGLGILKDSAFFAAENLGTVQQLKYEEIDFTVAIDLAITRLQLIELTRSLMADPSFCHLNSFETELLPRIAEVLVIWKTSKEGEPVNALQAFKQLGLSLEHARMIAEMDTASLWKLLVESQQALLDQEFVEDEQGLLHPVERSSGLGNKPRPPFKTTELTKRALQTRLGGKQPVNLIGSRRSK